MVLFNTSKSLLDDHWKMNMMMVYTKTFKYVQKKIISIQDVYLLLLVTHSYYLGNEDQTYEYM